MTWSVAYVCERWFTTFSKENSMPPRFNDVILFFKAELDAKEGVLEMALKCFMHHIWAPSWIPLT